MKRLLSAGVLALVPFSAFASVAVVPEPGTLGLVALGVAAGLYVAHRGRRK